MNEDTQHKITELSQTEQNVQYLGSQRQRFQSQLMETESAMQELKNEGAYKIIGNIMVKKSSSDLKGELEERKEFLKVRIDSLKKQEEKLQEKLSKLQEEVMSELNEKGE